MCIIYSNMPNILPGINGCSHVKFASLAIKVHVLLVEFAPLSVRVIQIKQLIIM